MEYRNQSELANFSPTHLEMASQRQAFAVNELTDENQMLSEALTHSRKQAELYENNMEQITREYRKKINEATMLNLKVIYVIETRNMIQSNGLPITGTLRLRLLLT